MLFADTTVMQMVKDDHSNIPGERSPEFILRAAIQIAEVTTRSVRVRGGYGRSTTTIAHCILIPPISKSSATCELLRKHIMAASFTFDVPKRGVAKPWLGSDPQNPASISCSDCHGVDHYSEECSIVNAPEYRAVRGIVEYESSDLSVLTSLTVTPAALSQVTGSLFPTEAGAVAAALVVHAGDFPVAVVVVSAAVMVVLAVDLEVAETAVPFSTARIDTEGEYARKRGRQGREFRGDDVTSIGN